MIGSTQKTYATECLFQKLGNTWYVFTELEDNILFSALPEGIDPNTQKLELYEVVEKFLKDAKEKSPKTKKKIAEIAA